MHNLSSLAANFVRASLLPVPEEVSLDSEIESMKTDSTKSISDFEKVYSEEVTTRIQTLKEDAAQKIDAEKSEMINELNSNLLDLVISNAKSQIKSNPELAKNASSKMVEGL